MRWLGERDLAAEGAVRLFCLPHAGSGAAVFHRWKRLLPAGIAVCPVSLPGREMRLREPLLESVGEIVEGLLEELSLALDRPYAVFGHSMGALLGYELVRRVERAGLRRPEWLFASGRVAPQVDLGVRELHLLQDKEFVEALGRRYGGMPEGLLEDEEMRGVFLPVLRADLKVVETYGWVDGARLRTPVLALAGDADGVVDEDGLRRWGDLTVGEFAMGRVAGGHFYHLEGGQGELMRLLEERLKGWV